MAKINFTQEHFAKLQELALIMLFDNSVVSTPTGQQLGVVELLHTTTINSLNSIRTSLSKKIEAKESVDEWGITDKERRELDNLKLQKDFVNLIVGWKRRSVEIMEAKKVRKELETQLKTLKESTKTPEDKIKELETQLAGLENF